MDTKAWLIAADMGYGHKRALFPLKFIAHESILITEVFKGNSLFEKFTWKSIRLLYEAISRYRELPIIGRPLYTILNLIMHIPQEKDNCDISKATPQVYLLNFLITIGVCREIINHIKSDKLPLITSFYAPSIAAEKNGLEDITIIICDSDISRAWIPTNPQQSIINYCVPCKSAYNKLISYGVPQEKITLTGFPLPRELVGKDDISILKVNLLARIKRLDPLGKFRSYLKQDIYNELSCSPQNVEDSNHITITYAVGGAGAQKSTGIELVKFFSREIMNGIIKINLVAGKRNDVKKYFINKLEKLDLQQYINILYVENDDSYFKSFNSLLQKTDILFTKPSELSFYCGLGIPIVTLPCLGPHEEANKRWLQEIGATFDYVNFDNIHKEFFEMIECGKFAEFAWNGFMNAYHNGTQNIIEQVNLRRSL